LLEENLATRPDRDVSIEGSDLAVVADKSTHEDDIAPGGTDRPEVGHSLRRIPVEPARPTVKEVVVIDIERRENRVAADVDDTIRSDDNAVRVDYVDIGIALELAVDLGDVTGDDP